jgi:hypothetical protein
MQAVLQPLSTTGSPTAGLDPLSSFLRDSEPLELVPFPLTTINHMESSSEGATTWIAKENIRVGRDANSLGYTLDELRLSNNVTGVVGLERQCTSDVFPAFRYSKNAVDYFLSHIVFPKEMRELPHKLLASGGDIGKRKRLPLRDSPATTTFAACCRLTLIILIFPSRSIQTQLCSSTSCNLEIRSS